MIAGIKEILIISKPEFLNSFKNLFGEGKHLGLKISYAIQKNPGGLAEAFIIGKEFIGSDDVCLVLGDNIFYGSGLDSILNNARLRTKNEKKATIFGYYVENPQSYGVVEFNSNKVPLSIEEKPRIPKSNYAVVGLYFYPNSVLEIARNIKPSKRNELEITDVNKTYLLKKNLKLEILDFGYVWLDTGTHDSLSEASEFVKAIEKRQGLKIGCIEEVSLNNGWINLNQIKQISKDYSSTDYGRYILKIVNRCR